MSKDDILKDKVFTKTAFAVRIDILESGIQEERELRARMEHELLQMRNQFLKLSVSNSKLMNVSIAEAENFWATARKYMPEQISSALACVEENGKPQISFISSLAQALRVYGMEKIGSKEKK